MTNQKPIKLPVAEPHLSVDKLYQYLKGKLSATAANQIEQHLQDCDLCADALEGLSLASQSDTELALFDINRYVKKKSILKKDHAILRDIKNWGLIAAILFLLIFSAVVVWYQANQTKINTTQPAPPTETRAPLQVPTPIPIK